MTATQESPALPIPATAEAVNALDRGAADAISAFNAWALDAAGRYELDYVSATVRRWRSVEEPDSVYVVVDLEVRGDRERAFSFWDVSSMQLASELRERGSSIADRVSVDLRLQ